MFTTSFTIRNGGGLKKAANLYLLNPYNLLSKFDQMIYQTFNNKRFIHQHKHDTGKLPYTTAWTNYKQEAHGPQCSPELTAVRLFTHHSLLARQVSRQCLKQFLRYLAYKIKMLKFSKAISKKSSDYVFIS